MSSKLEIGVAEFFYCLLCIFGGSSDTSGQHLKRDSGSRKFSSIFHALKLSPGQPLTGAAAVQLAPLPMLAVLQLTFLGSEVSPAILSNHGKGRIEISPGLWCPGITFSCCSASPIKHCAWSRCQTVEEFGDGERTGTVLRHKKENHGCPTHSVCAIASCISISSFVSGRGIVGGEKWESLHLRNNWDKQKDKLGLDI